MRDVVRRSLRDEVDEALWRQGAEAAYAGERTMWGVGYAKKVQVRCGFAMDMEALDLQGRAGGRRWICKTDRVRNDDAGRRQMCKVVRVPGRGVEARVGIWFWGVAVRDY